MKAIAFEDQSADALQLSLWSSPLDQSALHIIGSATCRVPPFSLSAAIIGGSHFWGIHGEQFVLYELFACTSIVTQSNRLLHCALREATEGSVTLTLSPSGHQYRNTIRKMALDTDGSDCITAVQTKIAQAQEVEHAIGIAYNFPNPDNWPVDPLTAVWLQWSPADTAVLVETLHVYPNENVVVHTDTTLQLINQ